MVNSMATRKVTITVDEAELDRIREIVAAGKARSVSSFVQDAVTRSLDGEQLWAEHLSQSLDATGGPATADEQAWLDATFERIDGSHT